eukprot:COSAG01_NODE_9984_length_2255_cov_8.679029_2_plen_246_part_00
MQLTCCDHQHPGPVCLCAPRQLPLFIEWLAGGCAQVAGEVTWVGLLGMLAWCGVSVGESFLDCGAGHGKAMALYAAMGLGAARGYELRPGVARTGQVALAAVTQRLRRHRKEEGHDDGDDADADGPRRCCSAELHCGDMFGDDVHWDDAIVLVNATGFDDEMVAWCVRKLTERTLTEGPPPPAPTPAAAAANAVSRPGTAATGKQHRRDHHGWRHRRRRVLSLSQPLRSPHLRSEGAPRRFRVSW